MFSKIRLLLSYRIIIFNMAKNDFNNRYSGSYFGITWSIVQPLITIIIYWFVFQIAFKATPISNAPFILYLCAGMIPWSFFSDGLINVTTAFTSYSFIVKKFVFKLEILPIVKVLGSLFLNIPFNILLVIIFLIYGIVPSFLSLVDIIYYLFSLFLLIVSLGYILSTLNVFFKDTIQIINILLQFGVWLTPIMWNENMIPYQYRWIIKINPVYYIVNGYRQSLINNIHFFNFYNQTLYFWLLITVLITISIIFYKKMKPHFADVL